MSEIPTMVIGEGNSAVLSHTLIKRIPVNYTPGTSIQYGNKILFVTGRTLRPADMKVFFCVLKAYTDNKHDALQSIRGTPITEIDISSTVFAVDVAEISKLAYGTRARGTRLVQSLERMTEMKIHLLNDKSEMMGFVQLVSGAKLSKDRKTLEVAMNKSFLKDMAREMIQYDFPKMLSLNGRAFVLYIAVQQYKYKISEGKYGYTYIPHEELCNIMNIHGKNAKYDIAKTFKEIGINFVLHSNGKWHYPKAKIISKKDGL